MPPLCFRALCNVHNEIDIGCDVIQKTRKKAKEGDNTGKSEFC